jgi:hypothetical protein
MASERVQPCALAHLSRRAISALDKRSPIIGRCFKKDKKTARKEMDILTVILRVFTYGQKKHSGKSERK